MALWIITAIVGWASFQLGRWIAMWFRPRVFGAKASPVPSSRIAAIVVVIAALVFFAWNQKARAYPFTILHAGILAGCMVFGYQLLQARQSSLQNNINSLSQGVSEAFAQRLPDGERLRALVAVAMQDMAIALAVKRGLLVAGHDGRPSGRVKMADDTLIDDATFPNAILTSTGEKIDLLLQEVGFAILAKFGEDVMPKDAKQSLGQRELQNLRESSERTRALLDANSIDWAHVNDALYHISEAKLRIGIEPSDLTSMEQRVRSQRRA